MRRMLSTRGAHTSNVPSRSAMLVSQNDDSPDSDGPNVRLQVARRRDASPAHRGQVDQASPRRFLGHGQHAGAPSLPLGTQVREELGMLVIEIGALAAVVVEIV